MQLSADSTPCSAWLWYWLLRMLFTKDSFFIGSAWSRLPWKLPVPREAEALDEQANVLSRQTVDRQDDQVTIRCTGEAFAYRLVP